MTDGRERRRAGQGADPHTDVTGALHDVSNALTVLLGWVAEARAPGATDESIRRALFVIESRARVARDLARRAIGGAPQVVDAAASVGAVLKDVLDGLEVEAQQSGVRLVHRGASDVQVAMAGDVSQIVTNVVLNALAYSPRGSEVAVEVAAAPKSVTIDIRDQGPGVPASRRDGIFEGDSTREGGAGVGLRHARALARAAGGELELVASAGSQVGALFRLTWPRGEALARSTSTGFVVPLLQGTRVLVVEDDEHVTLLLETALGARGAIVTIARTAAELTQALKDGQHDAALIDLSPIATDVNGAVAALRERSPKAALVFISGSAVGLPGVLAAESVRWVRKPFEVNELVTALLAAQDAGEERDGGDKGGDPE